MKQGLTASSGSIISKSSSPAPSVCSRTGALPFLPHGRLVPALDADCLRLSSTCLSICSRSLSGDSSSLSSSPLKATDFIFCWTAIVSPSSSDGERVVDVLAFFFAALSVLSAESGELLALSAAAFSRSRRYWSAAWYMAFGSLADEFLTFDGFLMLGVLVLGVLTFGSLTFGFLLLGTSTSGFLTLGFLT